MLSFLNRGFNRSGGLSQCYYFSKMSRQSKIERHKKDNQKGFASSDDKTIKLSKQEEENEARRRKALYDRLKSDKENLRTMPIREQNNVYEEDLTINELNHLKFQFDRMVKGRRLVKKQEIVEEQASKSIRISQEYKDNVLDALQTYNTMNQDNNQYRGKVNRKKYVFNSEYLINQQHQIMRIENPEIGSRRTGLLGYKMGMTSGWTKWGEFKGLTVIQVENCQVVQQKTQEKDGYTSLQVGCGATNIKKVNKPMLGHYLKANVEPKRHLKEFKITEENMLPVGYQLSVRHFTPGQFVDIQSVSIDKNFQGGMKRHNFKGQPKSHGCSISHRAIGSTGQRTTPGKVFKNKKMPGHLGDTNTLVRNIKVYKIDVERSLIYLAGSIPGKPGTMVQLGDSVRKYWQNREYLNHPTFVVEQDPTHYASQITMKVQEEDPMEQYIHDNDVVD